VAQLPEVSMPFEQARAAIALKLLQKECSGSLKVSYTAFFE
jgi:hypothetical protein